VREESIARRFGLAFGAMALGRSLFMAHCEIQGDKEDAGHWLCQIKHLEHLDVECPEATLRMAQYVGNVTILGRNFTPFQAERKAAEMGILGLIAVTGLDAEGTLLPEETLRGMSDLLSMARFDSKTGFFHEIEETNLLSHWDEIATELANNHKARSWAELGGVQVACTISLEAEDFPYPEEIDTPGTYYHANRELLDSLGVNASIVESLLQKADPAASGRPECISEFNRLCAMMDPYAEEEISIASQGILRDPKKLTGEDNQSTSRSSPNKEKEESYSTKPSRPQSAVSRGLKRGPQRHVREEESEWSIKKLPAKSCLRMAVEQLSRFMLSNKILIRRTLSTGTFSSLTAQGSCGQFVFFEEDQNRWVSGVQQSSESAVVGALLGLQGRATEKPHFSLKVGDLSSRARALLKSSEKVGNY